MAGKDTIRKLPTEGPPAETDAVSAEKRRRGRDELTDEGDDVRPACKFFGGCDPRLPAEP